MPTIPTPFIGGSEEPRRDLTPERHISQPYVPGGRESKATTERRAAREDIDTGPTPGERHAEAETEVEDRAEKDQPDRGAAVSGPAPQTARPESEIPDFLLGPDGAAAGTTGSKPPPDASPREEESQDTSEERVAGEYAERIRSLTAELAGQPLEVSIRKAFTAGYLAGRERE